MEAWIPVMKIFLNSPTPESEASTWFNHPTNNNSSPSSFISLLTKPTDAIVAADSSSSSSAITSSSPPITKRVMWIQTLPNMLQSRILSFLVYERSRFCSQDLYKLATNMLKGDDGEIDFWVKKSALQLFDFVSDSSYEWIFGLGLDSGECEGGDDEFESVPTWLKDEDGSSDDIVLPWLPASSCDEFVSRSIFDDCDHVSDSLGETEGDDDGLDEVTMEVDSVCPSSKNTVLDPETEKMVLTLKTRIINFESKSKTITLAGDIYQLCLRKGHNSFAIMDLIEPWKSDDETTFVLLSHLVNGSEEEEELGWAGHVLCSIILPKLLVLEEPASRVLLNAIIGYCKLHEKEAVNALLFPLIYRTEGINSSICDVITRIIKECLHFAHVSSFCHQLLCEKEDASARFICLPRHQCLLSKKLVWTESMFNLCQNILNLNVHLTQDSVDNLVYQVNEMAERFTKSLKFGNFLLCLVTRCSSLLDPHKLLLTAAVGRTNSLLTKSVLTKLRNL